ncbi:hypothetical protein [Oceanobacillus sp. CFH 90083]|uniref:hypothetical protein n=1 Tax=Oceanobacillus sp. CFH 90083 TaxID=2592336 RepID=UPI00128B194D|nr:hypothetical protein [Oceanobacillus sp. CFH 90083]
MLPDKDTLMNYGESIQQKLASTDKLDKTTKDKLKKKLNIKSPSKDGPMLLGMTGIYDSLLKGFENNDQERK